MTTLNVRQMQGVVQFPSFHLAMAVLLIYAMRGIRYWFPIMLFFNILVILATPAIGGHHLTDLAGGALVTAFAIGIAGRSREQEQITPKPSSTPQSKQTKTNKKSIKTTKKVPT